MNEGVGDLKFPLRGKYVAMVAPSFVVNFSYPSIIRRLKKLGFDKVVELTFGAKMVNREYHEELKNSKKMMISSACPGIVETIIHKFPQYKKNLAKIDSPMVAMGKICRKHFPKHQIVFISPCNFKKIEAENCEHVDYVIDYEELNNLFVKYKIKKSFIKREKLDKFYNDYTKIYPLSGSLAKTAHLKEVICEGEWKSIDGIQEVIKFLENPDKKIKFLDCLFCEGGCVGGLYTNKDISLKKKVKKVKDYLKKSKKQNIPEDRKGLIKKAKGLKFSN